MVKFSEIKKLLRRRSMSLNGVRLVLLLQVYWLWSRFVSDLWGTMVLSFFPFRVTFRAGLLFSHGKIQWWLF